MLDGKCLNLFFNPKDPWYIFQTQILQSKVINYLDSVLNTHRKQFHLHYFLSFSIETRIVYD